MELQGAVATITGGAIRVGRSIALALAGRGCHVGLHYRSSRAAAEATAEELRGLGVEAALSRGDMRSLEDIGRIAGELEQVLGVSTILVNNASVFYPTPFPGVTAEAWDELFETNVRGPFFLAQEWCRRLGDRGGVIVNLLDWAADRPDPAYLPYSMTKAALAAATRGLARKLAPRVRVVGIAPGPVLLPEDFSDEEAEDVIRTTPLQRLGSPEDIARAALYLVEHGDYVTGSTLYVDGGCLAG